MFDRGYFQGVRSCNVFGKTDLNAFSKRYWANNTKELGVLYFTLIDKLPKGQPFGQFYCDHIAGSLAKSLPFCSDINFNIRSVNWNCLKCKHHYKNSPTSFLVFKPRFIIIISFLIDITKTYLKRLILTSNISINASDIHTLNGSEAISNNNLLEWMTLISSK